MYYNSHHKSLTVLSTFLITSILLHISRPPPPSPSSPPLPTPPPDLETLLSTLHQPPTTDLQTTYKTHTKCAHVLDLAALRRSLPHTPPHPLVICLTHPPTATHLHLIRKLTTRLGPPFITTTNLATIHTLTQNNITPLLPTTPQHALAAIASSSALLVQGSPACAISARLTSGVVYYTADYLAFIAIRGYEWLPITGARLDGFDRRHRAVLAGLGVVEQSCCTFQQGICRPLPSCTAVILGRLQHPINCRILFSTPCISNCPKWPQLIANGIPSLLILDISGYEFFTLHHLSSVPSHLLPRQIVVRLRVWSSVKLSADWKPLAGGWLVSRNLVVQTVLRLRNRGFRLVHRVDDQSCEWCAFVTFLRD